MHSPEEFARQMIDRLLEQAGWKLQHRSEFDRHGATGVAVREFQLPAGPCDYLLFIDGIAEAFSTAEFAENARRAERLRSAALRQSILKGAFSGRLVPQDPSDEPASELLTRIQAARDAAPIKTSRKTRA